MLNRRFRECAGIAILAALVCAAPAAAQRPRPDRPYRGLFGGNGADPNSTQALDLNVSLSAAYDQNVLASGQIALDPRFEQSGNYENGTISLDYSRRTGRATLDFTGGTSYRYYPSLKEMNGTDSFASVGLSAKLSSRTTIHATESASYLPFYSLGAMTGLPAAPGAVAPITSGNPLVQDSALSLSSSASLDSQLTQRSSFSADYLAAYTKYRASQRTYDNWTAGAGYGYKLSSRTSMRLRYHYSSYDNTVSGVSQPAHSHDMAFGMDYTEPLSPTRAMTMGFSVGTSLYSNVTPPGPAGSVYLNNHFLVTGNAYMTRQFGRSWSANLSYKRGIQLVQGFSSPFFSDSVSAGLSGFFSPRSRVTLSASVQQRAGWNRDDQPGLQDLFRRGRLPVCAQQIRRAVC